MTVAIASDRASGFFDLLPQSGDTAVTGIDEDGEMSRSASPGGTARRAPGGQGASKAQAASRRGHDDQAFDHLYRELQPRVRGLVRRLVRDRDMVEDIVQETFLRAFRSSLHLQDGSEEEWPWLATVARNLCLDLLRRRQRVVECPVEEPDQYRPAVEETDPEMDRVSEVEGIAATLRAVTPREQRILVHHHLRGRPYREIAAAEGLSLDALKSAMARARRRFRQEFLALSSSDDEITLSDETPAPTCSAA